MFRIRITDEQTGEWTEVLGQGKTVEDAFRDGLSNAREIGGLHGIRKPDGKIAMKTLKAFEAGVAAAPEPIDLGI